MSTELISVQEILIQRAADMQDASSVYALAARLTAARMAEVRKLRDSGGLDDDEYAKQLKLIESEDKLMSSVAKNFHKSAEIRAAANTPVEVVDYEAKLKAI
tara:strand:- start:5864 stop:6169 length:306 start_codon:yes stop_codon:yes gene_type:complete